jgi:D-lactate dehydrogenase (cytochrome)
MAAAKDTAFQALGRVLSPRQVVTDALELMTYEVDASLSRGLPDGLVFPHSTQDVARIVGWARQHGIPLIARGAGTGLSGGAVPHRGGVIVGFSHMKEILEFDEPGRSAVVQPGVVNQALDEYVKARGLYYPPDPASGRSATIGGNLGENSGGPHCFKYGVTTNYVTGLEVVLADGRVLRLGGRALDYPEYDLIGLMVGSEGTLGLMTEASVRLMRNPMAVKTMMAAFDSIEQAGEAVSAVIAHGLIPSTLEMMDRQLMQIVEDYAHVGLPVHATAALIIEADGYPDSVTPQIEEIAAILRDHEAHDLRIAGSAEERNKIWHGRKSAIGAMARLAPAYFMVDGTVPRSKLARALSGINRICEAADLRVGYVFHAGDGNLHPLILIPNPSDPALMQRVFDAGRESMALCVSLGGSITGEHGVGIEKRGFMPLMYGPDELAAMKDIKEVFDPGGLLNPDKIFPPEGFQPPALPAGRVGLPGRFAPASAEEAAEAVRGWLADGQRVRVQGNGTKSGALPEADVLLTTQQLCGIREYAADDLYVTAGAGTTVAELQAELGRGGYWVPLVSPWPAATLGGLLAANFNAPLRMRYGAARDLVLALTVVLPDGRIIRAGRPVVKNVAGYDLPKLFIGSYGSLGLIAGVTLKFTPLPRAWVSLVAPVDSLERGAAWGVKLLQLCLVSSALLLTHRAGTPLSSAPYELIYTAEGLAEDVTAELAEARGLLEDEGARGLLQVDALSGSQVWADWMGAESFAAPAAVTMRAGVAPKDMPGFLKAVAPALADASFVTDLANGLLYLRSAQDAGAVRRPASDMGGYAVVLAAPPAAAAEPWGHAPEGLDLMRAIKSRWDPAGRFNPGAFLV